MRAAELLVEGVRCRVERLLITFQKWKTFGFFFNNASGLL